MVASQRLPGLSAAIALDLECGAPRRSVAATATVASALGGPQPPPSDVGDAHALPAVRERAASLPALAKSVNRLPEARQRTSRGLEPRGARVLRRMGSSTWTTRPRGVRSCGASSASTSTSRRTKPSGRCRTQAAADPPDIAPRETCCGVRCRANSRDATHRSVDQRWRLARGSGVRTA